MSQVSKFHQCQNAGCRGHNPSCCPPDVADLQNANSHSMACFLDGKMLGITGMAHVKPQKGRGGSEQPQQTRNTAYSIWGVSQNKRYPSRGPHNKDCTIWGSIVGSPYFGKLPCQGSHKGRHLLHNADSCWIVLCPDLRYTQKTRGRISLPTPRKVGGERGGNLSQTQV